MNEFKEINYFHEFDIYNNEKSKDITKDNIKISKTFNYSLKEVVGMVDKSLEGNTLNNKLKSNLSYILREYENTQNIYKKKGNRELTDKEFFLFSFDKKVYNHNNWNVTEFEKVNKTKKLFLENAKNIKDSIYDGDFVVNKDVISFETHEELNAYIETDPKFEEKLFKNYFNKIIEVKKKQGQHISIKDLDFMVIKQLDTDHPHYHITWYENKKCISHARGKISDKSLNAIRKSMNDMIYCNYHLDIKIKEKLKTNYQYLDTKIKEVSTMDEILFKQLVELFKIQLGDERDEDNHLHPEKLDFRYAYLETQYKDIFNEIFDNYWNNLDKDFFESLEEIKLLSNKHESTLTYNEDKVKLLLKNQILKQLKKEFIKDNKTNNIKQNEVKVKYVKKISELPKTYISEYELSKYLTHKEIKSLDCKQNIYKYEKRGRVPPKFKEPQIMYDLDEIKKIYPNIKVVIKRKQTKSKNKNIRLRVPNSWQIEKEAHDLVESIKAAMNGELYIK